MKASEIQIGYAVETPDSNLVVVLHNDAAKRSFLASHGDVEVVYSDYYQHYIVPGFGSHRTADRK